MNSIKKILTILKGMGFVNRIKTLIGTKKKVSDVKVDSFITDTSSHDWEQYNDNVSF